MTHKAVQDKLPHAAVLPLVILAFFLQGMLPIVNMDFYLSLLVDDFASLIISVALCLAVPHIAIRTKIISMAYSTFCLYSIMHNIVIELRMDDPEPFKRLAIVVSLALFGFLVGTAICISQVEKNEKGQ